MSSNFTSFTITQAFLGAPLQFTPALGSQELDQLIDAYVPGTASRPDKLSEVTIDFYNHATVDLNTGSLVRRYDVLTQSPTQSQSSGFSPAMYTPSPASSGYGSISMTPPVRNRGGRVSKPSKKDTKKVAEARLPGFSIMTKDGIDVTSSAGRGTKTKEQREHAHLMRIMKACDDCKRKKVRCDPSHRRQSNEMSRSSTAKTSSSSRTNPSPPAAPSLPQTPFASQSTSSSGSFSNAIDDFVLFPEDASASWNPADLSLPEDADLSNFNFDINDINLDLPMNNDFDFSAFNNMQPMDFNQLYEPSVPQYSMDQWVNLPVSHTRPHPSASSQDSGQLDMDLQDSWVQALPESGSYSRPQQSSSQELAQSSFFSTANVSPQSIGSLADEIWPDGNRRNGHGRDDIGQFYDRVQQPFSERSVLESTTQQQSLSENSPYNGSTSSPIIGLQQSLSEYSRTENSPTDTSQYSPAESSRSGSNASSRTSLQADDLQYWTESTDKTKRGRESPAAALARRQLSSSGGGRQESSIDTLARPDGQAGHIRELQHPVAYESSPGLPRGHDRPQPTRSSLGVSNDIFGLANTCTLVSESLRAVKQGPAECLSLAGELQRLRTALAQYHSEARSAETSGSVVTAGAGDTASQMDTFGRQLQGLSASIRQSQVQGSPVPQGVLRQTQVQAQLLLRSLCATINSLHTSRTGSSSARPSNYQPLTSGRNLQLFVPASEGHDRDRHNQLPLVTGVDAMYDGHLIAQDSRSTPPRADYFATRLQEDEGRYTLAFNKDAYEGAFAPGVGSVVPAWEIHDSPWTPVLAKQVLSSLQRPVVQTELQQEAGQVATAGVRLDTNVPSEVASPALDTALHYRKVVILATLASAIIATITRTASMLALFIPLSALRLSPTGESRAAALSCMAIMALMGTGCLQTLQNSCQDWTSTNTLVSIARFALCAAMVAQPPSFLACAKAMATLFSLLGSNSGCCGAGMEADSVNSRRNSSQALMPSFRTESRRPQWLGMMDRLTAVAA